MTMSVPLLRREWSIWKNSADGNCRNRRTTEKDIVMKQKILIIEPDSSFSDLEKDLKKLKQFSL